MRYEVCTINRASSNRGVTLNSFINSKNLSGVTTLHFYFRHICIYFMLNIAAKITSLVVGVSYTHDIFRCLDYIAHAMASLLVVL